MEIRDFSKFDNDTDPSDEDYAAFVEWLSERTASELRQAKGDVELQKKCLYRYYRQGEHAHLSAEELIDFLGVSTPSILEIAGYNEEEAAALMALSDSLDWTEYNGTLFPEGTQHTSDF